MEYLQELESESIHIIREAFACLGKCCILFSGGKDSIVLTWLAKKSFHPLEMPFDIVHIDTGHNFQETLDFRDGFVKKLKLNLIVGEVEKNIQNGSATEETGLFPSRNRAQSVTLRETIALHQYQGVFGGGRRDEEKARAKERIYSLRDNNGGWEPTNQRPELWHLFSGRKQEDEHFRVFPLSNWTELDIWNYIQREGIELPSLYFSHERQCVEINKSLLAHSVFFAENSSYPIVKKRIRFRTIGDMTISGAVESTASTVEEIIAELRESDLSERGYRMDDQKSDSAMEERKREGYF
jgi:sulfate adenylyltransferase subunit 2